MSLDFLKHSKSFEQLYTALLEGKKGLSVSGIIPAAKPYLLSLLSREYKKPIIFIRPLSYSLSSLSEGCRFFLSQSGSPEDPVLLPSLSDNPYQELSPSLETVSARMYFFYRVLQSPPPLLITNLPGLLRPIPCPQDLSRLFLELRPGASLGRDAFIQRLAEYGYAREDLVNSHGEFAWRGGVVDVFSPWEEYPVRIEFSGDEIASLREFQPATQRSIRKIDSFQVPGLIEFSRSRSFPCLPVLQPGRFVSFDLFYPDALFIIDDIEETEREWEETFEDYQQQFKQRRTEEKISAAPEKIFPPSLWDKIKREALHIREFESGGKKGFHFSFQSVPRFSNKIPFFLEYIKRMQDERERCYIYFSQEGVRRKLSALLSQNNIARVESPSPLIYPEDESVILLLGNLERGFRFLPERITYFSEKDIFTEERILVSRPRVRPFVSDFRDLRVDDYVVHTDYGIGIFKGLVKLEIDAKEQEFIKILYRDEDKLYVPAEDLNLVQKYARLGTTAPLLNKLGTMNWERTKERAKKSIEKMAKQLLHLYAQRKAINGFAFSLGGEWQSEFEQTFEYEETEDQLQAINDIYKDMEAPSPMDRLLCGDVGYGKTEVAIRASFKAVMDGKQVAVLCPTTVLASQHLNTFRNRMVLFPVRIESLTRLQTKAQQKKILAEVKKGSVDIIIGTHRLLSDDVAFHELGLLIVDEEQRFGVGHKEKIKQMKSNIDVLTMTATPIPRTLNLSLSGLRDISLIETPPKDRLSIHTVVTSFSQKLIASAILKELGRGGQVYFIHNRVEDIDDVALKIESWVSGAKVTVVHGKMSGPALEKRMIDFISRKSNVLVSTTIIENGIDIPLVNTLIVNRADRFGLAQLYQLRGRVGRSSRQAIAFFLIPPFVELTRLSKERLKALQEFSELGSGFRLAAKDLEIRGAGNFLGSQQHGCMEAVGFDYYMHLLDQTIKELKGDFPERVKSEINLKVDIRIPEEFLPQTNLRLNLYKRISSVERIDDIETLRKEIQDRFGPLPREAENLLRYGVIKFLAQKSRIKTIDRIGKKLVLQFHPTTDIDFSRIPPIMEKYKGSVTPQGVMDIDLFSEGDSKAMDETICVLKELSGM
jgi:transcription-repair coupling factor (superfamily II helicase)